MTEQLAMFPLPTSPLAGRTDPLTSHESAQALKRNPARLGRLQRQAYNLVVLNDGRTVPELAGLAIRGHRVGTQEADAEYQRQRIGRRMSELHRAGMIEARGVRNGCQIWWIS